MTDPDGSQVIDSLRGQVLFASSNDRVHRSDDTGDPDEVLIEPATPASPAS